MRDFEYEAPEDLSQALALLSRSNGAARPLAGGTDLIDHIRTGRLTPNVVVDVKKLPELNLFECDQSGLRLGAAVSCRKINASPEVRRYFSALSDATSIIGGTQIQSRATVGGNLCTSGAAADSTPALMALEAVAVLQSASGQRIIPVEEFCTAPMRNCLQPGEMLIELKCPSRPANSGSHYRRFIPRNEMDIAVVGVGASVVLDESGQTFQAVRIAMGAVAPHPILATDAAALLIGQPVNDDTIQKSAEAARAAITPITDMRGTVEFRKHVTGVLVERVLREAIERARHPENIAPSGRPHH